VSTYATKAWIEEANWDITTDWKQYFVSGQVGGYVETRNNGKFTFATIHGAGHMAPN
jgi:serine carboxypeptidase-like clade 1